MDSSYNLKQGAEVNDVFVVLKQEVMLEPPSILTDLQLQYGGRLRFPFHITCQRFPCSQEQLPEVVTKLEPYLRTIKKFSISINSVQSLYSKFFDCEVLKARIYPTEYFIEVSDGINRILESQELPLRYKIPSTWITLLEDISKLVPETKIETTESILKVDLAIIDQLQSDKSFKPIKEIKL